MLMLLDVSWKGRSGECLHVCIGIGASVERLCVRSLARRTIRLQLRNASTSQTQHARCHVLRHTSRTRANKRSTGQTAGMSSCEHSTQCNQEDLRERQAQ